MKATDSARAGPAVAKAMADKGEDLCPFCGSAVPEEVGVRIVAGRGEMMQVRRTGKRNLFGKGAKQVFLEWFAATGNVSFAAKQAGVTRQTVSKHRLADADFAERYAQAIALCVPDLQARLHAWLSGGRSST